jgi:ankyrin repeat protein
MKDIASAIIQKIMDSKDIQKRKSFGITNSEGNTALMLACKKHLQDVVLALIETGESNLEAINKYDETALSIACEENLDVKQQIMDKINERKTAEKKVACPELKNLLELDENNKRNFVFKFIQNTKHTYRPPAHWEKVDESYFDEKMQNDVYRKCSG